MTQPLATLHQRQKAAHRDMHRAESDQAYLSAKATFDDICRQLATSAAGQDIDPACPNYCATISREVLK